MFILVSHRTLDIKYLINPPLSYDLVDFEDTTVNVHDDKLTRIGLRGSCIKVFLFNDCHCLVLL